MDYIRNDYETILERKEAQQEGSYTCYLFEKGLDKILKKVGEESTEMVIAAKKRSKGRNSRRDLRPIYHTLVMMANEGITPDDVDEELRKRAEKAGNLKKISRGR